MLIEEVKFDVELIRGPLPHTGDGSRSATLHLSDIYKDLEDTIAPREEMEQALLKTYGRMGFIWEQVLEQGMTAALVNERYIRPGEFTKEGVTGSPDLIDIEEWAVIDSKVTWRSSRKLEHFEKYFWIWGVQLKGYCYMVGASTAYLWIFFVNGNWKPPVPEIRKVKITFSRYEIEENWRMLMGHAKKRGWLR